MVELLLFHDNAQSDHHYSYSIGVATYLKYHVKALVKTLDIVILILARIRS